MVDQFSKKSKLLRAEFDKRFANPLEADNQRFVWDFWHVPDQYTLVRTPAYHYFSQKLYMDFHSQLVSWGRKTLGCWDISPPWLSYYIEGCKQELHSDVPHGPWAFVYSLTPEIRRFKGGETLILKPEILNYWQNFGQQTNRELTSFVDRIPAKANRLIAFDPRLPHGVTEVRGTMDPREARLVIHGWFTQPKTYIDGFVPAKSAEKILNQAYKKVADLTQYSEAVQGVVSLGLSVGKSGQVNRCCFLTNTLLDLSGQVPKNLNKEILRIYSQLEFISCRGPTQMTVPLLFQ